MEQIINYLGSLLSGIKGDNDGLKIGIFIFIIITVFTINDITGISYLFKTNKQIEITEKIIDIKIKSNDKEINRQLDSIAKSVINYKSNIYNVYSSLFLSTPKTLQSVKYSIGTDKTNAKISMLKFPFIFHLTAGGLFYLLTILILPIMIFLQKEMKYSDRFFTGLLIGSITFIFGFILSWICAEIPTTSYVWLDLCINLLIQVSIIFLFKTFSKEEKV
jgi:hypothetical protein